MGSVVYGLISLGAVRWERAVGPQREYERGIQMGASKQDAARKQPQKGERKGKERSVNRIIDYIG